MLNRETVLSLFEATIEVFVHNLDFIPAERLDWKPAPDAKSALEIVNHLATFLGSISNALNGESETVTNATNGDEAKRVLEQAAARYAQAVRGASPEVLGRLFRDDMPLTNGWMVTASTIDTIHHAGQIAYIQTLLGDNEIHFNEAVLPQWAVG